MNIKEALLKDHSKKQCNAIIEHIGDDKKRFKILLDLFLGNDPLIEQRASWPLSYVCMAHQDLIQPHIGKLIKNLSRKNLHNAVIRNTFRLLEEVDIPEKYCGTIFDFCVNNIKNTTLPHAIRVFSIGTAENLCKKYPELKTELILLLLELKKFPQPPSMTARIKMVLKRLQKNKIK